MFYENTDKAEYNSCCYFVKHIPVIDQGWSIFPNNLSSLSVFKSWQGHAKKLPMTLG